MAFNWDLLVPYKYGNTYITLRQLEAIMFIDYHPEYTRRFIGWLHFKNGNVGAGSMARTEQPNKPGFAPSLYQSFHWAGQVYNDGFTGACAVDTVYKDGPDPGDAHDGIQWREVPIQGSAEAARWGIHANVGVPGDGESWHLQPIEIDGHGSWVAAGRPSPVFGYPIPQEHDPAYKPPLQPEPEPEPPRHVQEDEEMLFIAKPTFPGAKPSDPWIVYYTHPGSGKRAERAINAHIKAAEILGVPIVPQDSPDQYFEALLKYGIPRP